MNILSPSTAKQNRGRSHPLVFFLLTSALLHLLIFSLLPELLQEPSPAAERPEPTLVSLEEHPRWRELDQPPVEEETPPEQAEHLAETARRVEQEMAPRGKDSRDQAASTPTPPAPPASQSPPPPSEPLPTPAPPRPKPATPAPERLAALPPESAGSRPLPQPAEKPAPVAPAPLLRDLTRLAPTTLARLQGSQQRIKERPEVAMEADSVWLNQQHDLLISFFRRFSDQVEAVWNYPDEASRNGIEGILLLKITIDRQGNLEDVDLLEESGSDLLDYEAIQAIYRAAPFGPLSQHYPHEQLKIYAFFKYNLDRRYIYGIRH